MRFDPEYVQSWYDGYGDQESQRWFKNPAFRMQYEIYFRHLRQRVNPGDRLLNRLVPALISLRGRRFKGREPK